VSMRDLGSDSICLTFFTGCRVCSCMTWLALFYVCADYGKASFSLSPTLLSGSEVIIATG
jgi:hypothetical protein